MVPATQIKSIYLYEKQHVTSFLADFSRLSANPHLQDENKAARVRALFLAGVRAAFLWHQLGGRRWQLLFQRKRLLTAIESININNL